MAFLSTCQSATALSQLTCAVDARLALAQASQEPQCCNRLRSGARGIQTAVPELNPKETGAGAAYRRHAQTSAPRLRCWGEASNKGAQKFAACGQACLASYRNGLVIGEGCQRT